MQSSPGEYVDLLLAGTRRRPPFVRLNGIVYEATMARLQRRRRCALYHSALEGMKAPSGRFVIEMTPVRASEGNENDIVAPGPVGSHWAGRLRVFTYEVRRWRDGHIPDVAEALDSPRRVSNDPETSQAVLDVVPEVPTPVWVATSWGRVTCVTPTR